MRGFTGAAAALVAVHALADWFGLPSPPGHGTAALLMHLGRRWQDAVPAAALVGLATLVTALLPRRAHPTARTGSLRWRWPRCRRLPPVVELWQRTQFMAEIGAGHIFPTQRAAVSSIFDRLDRSICAHCERRLFEERKRLPLPPTRSSF